MVENSLYKTALSKAMHQCSHRELCCSEIEARLESWGVSKSDSRKIIEILLHDNFINEERYARAFVKDKFSYNKWGRIKITSHLRAKNISSGTISAALQSIDNDLYKNSVKSMIDMHRRSVKAKNSYEMKAKLLRFGLSRGFESSLLYEILNENEDL
jgi:regulatory protein